jgi:hypothetical protein
MQIGVIHNTRSERNRLGMAQLRSVLERASDIVELDLGAGSDTGGMLVELARREAGLVIINGGDGTVQGVLTALLEQRPFEELPLVAILPRGMANMTARDCGLRRGDPATVQRLLVAARTGELDRHLVERRILRIAGAVGTGPQRGMFFGAAGIFDAITLCKETVHTRGLKGEWANVTTLIELLAGWAIGRRPPGMLEGVEVRADVDGEVRRRRELLLLATTLDRLVLRARPFWNPRGRALRYTSIAYPPERLLRSSWRVLYGGDVRSSLPADSYFSRNADRVALDLHGPFTIDGEDFAADAGAPLVLTAPDVVRFVRL